MPCTRHTCAHGTREPHYREEKDTMLPSELQVNWPLPHGTSLFLKRPTGSSTFRPGYWAETLSREKGSVCLDL